MTGVKNKVDKKETINTIFCDRCGTLYGKIQVTPNVLIPMCPLCHRELFVYFVDEEMKFIHFGDMDRFAEIAEKIEAETDKMQFVKKDAFRKKYDVLPFQDFVETIRNRTRKMTILEERFEPKTAMGKQKANT